MGKLPVYLSELVADTGWIAPGRTRPMLQMRAFLGHDGSA